MKRILLICISIIILACGCAKVNYLDEFAGVPIYPGTEIMTNSEYDNLLNVMYVNMFFSGDIEKVKEFFEKNIDQSIWHVEKEPRISTGHNIDKIYAYILKSKERSATLTIAYSKSEKTGTHLYITICGDK